MPRYRIAVEYDGSAYCGWQRQPGVSTVQEVLESALTTACRSAIQVVGSGRTDTGVHARRQIAHFDAPSGIELSRVEHSVNGLLPNDIAVTRLRETTATFHARYDARSRLYRYYVSTEPRAIDRSWRVRLPTSTDFLEMNRNAAAMVGEHDFSSFCLTQSETRNRVCNVVRAEWVAEERDADWFFAIEADRFLHGMVRAIVGTLVQIGLGRRRADSIPEILLQRDRRAAGPAAMARGLVLHEVLYDSDSDSDTDTRTDAAP